MNDDNDDDFFSACDADEPVPEAERMLGLVVGPRAPTSEALNVIEEANIRARRPPVRFIEEDGADVR